MPSSPKSMVTPNTAAPACTSSRTAGTSASQNVLFLIRTFQLIIIILLSGFRGVCPLFQCMKPVENPRLILDARRTGLYIDFTRTVWRILPERDIIRARK